MRHVWRRASLCAVLVLSALTACSDDVSGPGVDELPDARSTMTITGWAPSVVFATRNGNRVSITARDSLENEVQFSINPVNGPGVFSTGHDYSTYHPASLNYFEGDQGWAGHLEGSSGTVTFTTLTSTYVSGRFSVTLMPYLATGAVTNRILYGTFMVYFKPPK